MESPGISTYGASASSPGGGEGESELGDGWWSAVGDSPRTAELWPEGNGNGNGVSFLQRETSNDRE